MLQKMKGNIPVNQSPMKKEAFYFPILLIMLRNPDMYINIFIPCSEAQVSL